MRVPVYSLNAFHLPTKSTVSRLIVDIRGLLALKARKATIYTLHYFIWCTAVKRYATDIRYYANKRKDHKRTWSINFKGKRGGRKISVLLLHNFWLYSYIYIITVLFIMQLGFIFKKIHTIVVLFVLNCFETLFCFSHNCEMISKSSFNIYKILEFNESHV